MCRKTNYKVELTTTLRAIVLYLKDMALFIASWPTLARVLGTLSALEGALVGHVGSIERWRMRLYVLGNFSMWQYVIFLGRVYVAMWS